MTSPGRRLLVPAFALTTILLAPALAGAASGAALTLHPVSVLPFVLLLLSVAVLPLVTGHWWHKNSSKVLVSVLLAVPVVTYLASLSPESHGESMHALTHELLGYFSFIVLLGSLYTVSGGIVLSGHLRATPARNTALLAAGALLANLIGTTGASMLLIRPFLRMNRHRQRLGHLVIFFIFTVSNLGGLLTPLGDPPLFLGFLKGVDFFWTLRLWPQWLLANGTVLTLFFLWDTMAFRGEPSWVRRADPFGDEPGGDAGGKERTESYDPLRLRGGLNFLFLGGILLAVLLQSEAAGAGLGQLLSRLFPCPDLTLRLPQGEAIMILMGVLSLLLTPRAYRQANDFTWAPILEVAIIFAGLFVTMVPALELLKAHGRELGVHEPWQYFWLTGLLSSFLDNAPTYLAFATMASGSSDLGILTTPALQKVLEAISCGAVFMGANTYIGNGPNFMVKAIADESGVSTPSFFGYMAYSGLILVPIWVAVTLLFFPGVFQ